MTLSLARILADANSHRGGIFGYSECAVVQRLLVDGAGRFPKVNGRKQCTVSDGVLSQWFNRRQSIPRARPECGCFNGEV